MRKLKKFLCVLLAVAMVTPQLPAMIVSAEEAQLLKAGSISASDSTITQEQPFAAGTAGSDIFRIPCLITLEDGSLVAAADARYTEYRDFGGIDTIASVSTDNGETWNYSFPIYFPDSDGSAGFGQATTAIDPALIEAPDGTIYCLADMNPTGVTTLDVYPLAGTGFVTVNGVERLALTSNYANASTLPTDDNTTTFDYYVGDFEDGYAHVIKRADNTNSQYIVDEWYNIYDTDMNPLTQTQVDSSTVIQQNAFYKDSSLHVYNTGYIWIVESHDGGLTWENPRILNPQIKRDNGNETALLVSPGKGFVDSDGTMYVGMYDTYSGESASFIYSNDNGVTWTRSADIPTTSSENEMVELADGTIRMFYRTQTDYICYSDITKAADGTYTIGARQQVLDFQVNSNCNVSAVYLDSEDQMIDGKPVILVSLPSGVGAWNRIDGRIYVFTVNEDKTMNHEYTYEINEGEFAYSCMSMLDDGRVGVLYEPGVNQASCIRYDAYTLDYVYGEKVLEKVELSTGEEAKFTYVVDESMTLTQEPDETIATIEINEEEGYVTPLYNSGASSVNTGISLTDAELTFTAAEGENVWKIYNEHANVYMTNKQESSKIRFFSTTEETMTVTPTENGRFLMKSSTGRYTIFNEYNNANTYNAMSSYPHATAAYRYDLCLLEKQDVASETDTIPGYKQVTEITDGKTYLVAHIAEDGTIYVHYPSTTLHDTAGVTKRVGTPIVSLTDEVVITAIAPGETTATMGNITYEITVLDPRDNPEYAGFDLAKDKFTYSTGSEQSGEGVEGPVKLAFDGEADTFWHSDWNPSWYGNESCEDYLWVEFDIAEPTVVDAIRYLSRPGNENGNIKKYRVEGKVSESAEWTTLTEGTWRTGAAKIWQLAEFDAVEVVALRLVAVETISQTGDNKFASAAELCVRTATLPEVPPVEEVDKAALEAAIEAAEAIEADGYTTESYAALEAAIEAAQAVADDEDATQEEVDAAVAALEAAVQGLEEEVPFVNPFEDVFETDYYYDPVMWAVQSGITDGWTPTLFAPEMGCTRGQVVTFLWRAAGEPTAENAENPFTDVAEGAYYYDAVLWAVEEGITDGWTEDLFAPEMTCTRGQIVTFIWRAAGEPKVVNAENPFADVAENAYYYDAVLWAVEHQITDGWTKDAFAPEMDCTRGQIVTFLYRYYSPVSNG